MKRAPAVLKNGFWQVWEAPTFDVCAEGLAEWFAIPKRVHRVTFVLTATPHPQSYWLEYAGPGFVWVSYGHVVQYLSVLRSFADWIGTRGGWLRVEYDAVTEEGR